MEGRRKLRAGRSGITITERNEMGIASYELRTCTERVIN